MVKKKALHLLLAVSLSANAMVVITWVMTKTLGYDMIDPSILFKNVVALATIAGVNMIFGWMYAKHINPLIVGSVHFLVASLTFVLFGLWAHWFPLNGGIILTGLLIFAVLFCIIWLFHYFYWKHQIKKMNRKLDS